MSINRVSRNFVALDLELPKKYTRNKNPKFGVSKEHLSLHLFAKPGQVERAQRQIQRDMEAAQAFYSANRQSGDLPKRVKKADKTPLTHFKNSFNEILFRGFGKAEPCSSIKFAHFSPFTFWRPENQSSRIDATTCESYLNDPFKTKWGKCVALSLATPLVHGIALLLGLVNKIVKIVTLSHFWHPSQKGVSLRGRIADFGRDLLKLVIDPLLFLGLELSAIYGWFNPHTAGKMYAAFERAAYGKALLAPCFQPSPTEHLFSGKITPNMPTTAW